MMMQQSSMIAVSHPMVYTSDQVEHKTHWPLTETPHSPSQMDGLAQGCSNSSTLAIELLEPCVKPSRCTLGPVKHFIEKIAWKVKWMKVNFIQSQFG